MTEKYNGWTNRQNWNIALWINNDENLYNMARCFMKTYKGKAPYVTFIKHYGMQEDRTPDNIKFMSTRINYKELNNMMQELI